MVGRRLCVGYKDTVKSPSSSKQSWCVSTPQPPFFLSPFRVRIISQFHTLRPNLFFQNAEHIRKVFGYRVWIVNGHYSTPNPLSTLFFRSFHPSTAKVCSS